MSRIVKSLVLVVGAVGVISVGMSGAFFSDNETSTGNTFAAGVLDLKVDNESYYNGNVCAPDAGDINNNLNVTEYVWQGSADFPVVGTACDTSWELDDLDNGHLFFNFTDLKPDDEGEDTISLHVQNDAWACMDLSLTSNNDISSNEPELLSGDAQDDLINNWDGELAQNIDFVWWADDGDNVLEIGENVISEGVQTLFDLATTSPFSVAIADAGGNIYGGSGSLSADDIHYIGKAWCFGDMTLDPVPQGQGVSPSVDPGVNCDGTGLGNETQTDGATLDVQFRAIQSRNNNNFKCNGVEERTTTITLIKQVVGINGAGPDNQPVDWTLIADGPTDLSGVTGSGAVTNAPVTPGSYDLSETGPIGYSALVGWSCVGGTQNDENTVTIAEGQNVTCTIVNTEDAILACDASLDLMLVLDRSGSINAGELGILKNASHSFVSSLAPSADGVHVGQSSFSSTATLDLHLTDDEAASHLAINGLTSGGTTDLEAGITLAIAELDNSHEHERSTTPDAIVIVTDGNPNVPNEVTGAADAAAAADLARAAGIEVFVIGVGSDVDATYLETEIADPSPDHYFSAADFTELQAILTDLIACDSTKKIYNFLGTDSTNAGNGVNPIAFWFDSDVFPWTTTADQNSTTTATTVNYTSISSDNVSRWISPDPGSTDFSVKKFRFFLTEPIGDIEDIKILWKGQPDDTANVSMWVHKAGTSEFVPANWVQLGASLSVPSDSDRYIVRHIDSSIGDFVGTGGVITIAVLIDNDDEIVRTDYIDLIVTSNP